MASIETDVLVIGGGPIGLGLSTEIGMRGLKVLLAEQTARGGHAPRAKTTNIRTRTHFRRWGLSRQLAEAAPLGPDYPYDVHFVTRLAGHRLATIENGFNVRPEHDDRFPEHGMWIPQYKLEQVLRDHVATLDCAEVRFNTRFVSLEQDAEGVSALLEGEGGVQLTVRARYMVGCDGARSAVRTAIGATMSGAYGLSRNYNVVFRAPGLAEAHSHGPGVMYWQVNSDGASLIGPIDTGDLWYFMPTGMKEGQTLSEAEASAAIAKATGVDMAYEILSTDEWVASRLIADTYRRGRVFLAGDACHLHPPFGGYGMNMGVGDSVDLGWKLSAALQGWGGPALLDSYEVERRPIHEEVMDEAVRNHSVLGGQLWREGLEDDTPEGAVLREEVGRRVVDTKTREFRTLATVLGFCYRDSPVIAAEESAPVSQSGQEYVRDARPGCLAPHAWLPDGRSLYDLFGTGFTLLAADAAEAAKAKATARALGAPLEVVINPPGVPVAELYGAALVLVRPDQHVAWRGHRWNPEALRRAAGLTTAVPA